MQNESTLYLVLFCALLAARSNRVTWDEAMILAPLSGPARRLSEEMLEQGVAMAS